MEAENSGPTFSFTGEETEAHTRLTWSSVYGTAEKTTGRLVRGFF